MITSVIWAPSSGPSYHLIATGGRDRHVRIQVKPAEEEPNVEGEDDDPRWSADAVTDFDHHKYLRRALPHDFFTDWIPADWRLAVFGGISLGFLNGVIFTACQLCYLMSIDRGA